MLSIKEKSPYIILAEQRHGLSMKSFKDLFDKDFTLLVDFKITSEFTSSKEFAEYGILVRPGMHAGIIVRVTRQDDSLITSMDFDYWSVEEENSQVYNSIKSFLESSSYSLNDRFIYIVTRKSAEICTFLFDQSTKELLVENTRKIQKPFIDYTTSPFYLGCSNGYPNTPPEHANYTGVDVSNVLVLESSKYSTKDLLTFIENTKQDEEILSDNSLQEDLVFYFNFNRQSTYKIWDLSGNCNLLEKSFPLEK